MIQIEISLDRDIREMDAFFDNLKFKAVKTAARQALNKAAMSTRSKAVAELLKRKRLKKKDLIGSKRDGTTGFVRVKKAKGDNLHELHSKVLFSGMPLPLILSLLGQKTPKIHRVAPSKRKPRKFEINRGQKKSKPGLFVQKADRGQRKFAVYRRKDPNDRSKGFVAQSSPSVAEYLRKRMNILRGLENTGIANLQKEYDRALANQLRQLKL